MTARFRLELGRLLRSTAAWLATVVTLALPLAGYGLFPPLSWTTMTVMYLANPIITGALGGSAVFILLTLRELDRDRRRRVDVLTISAASPVLLTVLRVLALVLYALLTAVLGFVLYLPYTAWRLDLVFSLGDYALCWFLMLFPALAFGVLAAAVCYLVLGRTDVSALAAALFLLASRTGTRRENPWWQWSLPKFPAMSDDFGNTLVFRMAAYSRLIWLCILTGAFLLALLCLRRYGRGPWGSLRQGLRRGFPAALAAVCLLGAGGAFWRNQPFLDHSPIDWMSVEEPDYFLEDVELTASEYSVDASDTLWGRTSGSAVYHLENRSGQARTLYFEMNAGYRFSSALVNGQPVEMTDCADDYLAGRHWACPIPAEREITVALDYGGMPQVWNVDGGMYLDDVISREYVSLSPRCLVPVPEVGTKAEDTPFSLEIALPADMTPVTSGEAVPVSWDSGRQIWSIEDTGRSPRSLYAADFVKVDLEGGGMPIEFYFSAKHREQLEGLDALASMEAAVAYCTEHYGPRTFEQGKPFKILQLTEFEFGGFASGNLSGTLEESFTVKNLEDREKGASGAEVLAHEIIHQWWGLGVMVEDPEDAYWTSEGLTTYSTYRLMEARYGEDYAKAHYLDAWESALSNSEKNFYVRHPEYLDRLPEEFAANIEASIQSVNQYDGTALMIKRAEALTGGQEALDAILSRLYQEGGTEMGPQYVTLNDFLNACDLTKEAVGRG